MTIEIIIQIAAFFLAATLAGAVLALVLASHIGRQWAARLQREDARSHRLQLRRQELLLAREFEAASALSALTRQFLPTFHFPAMAWDNACNEIAYDFAKIDSALGDFLVRHAAALPGEITAQLGECIGLTREHRFKITTPEVPATATRAAATLYEKLWKAESEMVRLVRG